MQMGCLSLVCAYYYLKEYVLPVLCIFQDTLLSSEGFLHSTTTNPDTEHGEDPEGWCDLAYIMQVF